MSINQSFKGKRWMDCREQKWTKLAKQTFKKKNELSSHHIDTTNNTQNTCLKENVHLPSNRFYCSNSEDVVVNFIPCNWEQIMLKFMPASYANLKVIIIYELTYTENIAHVQSTGQANLFCFCSQDITVNTYRKIWKILIR